MGSWVGVYARYPQYRPRSATVETIEYRVNDCFRRSMNGAPLAVDGAEMRDIIAYLWFLSRDVPIEPAPPGNPLPHSAPPTPAPPTGDARPAVATPPPAAQRKPPGPPARRTHPSPRMHPLNAPIDRGGRMFELSRSTTHRRGFLGRIAASAAAFGLGGLVAPLDAAARPTRAATGASANPEFEAWLNKITGKHKMVYDVPE